jgi:putative sterol carrier protein/putative NADPH-quinone reductase
MKVIAINSSPRAGSGESKTEMMLNSLLTGMRQAGAEVEIVNLREKKVRFCQGCFTCWTKTPGKCVLNDDMTNELFPKWRESDLVVYATPLYHYTVNAHLKAFIERTLPMLEPFFVETDKGTHHPLRFKPPAVVMLSVAGFPEMHVFDLLSSWARFIFKEGLRAEIYRPAAEFLARLRSTKVGSEVLQATEQAGRELVESGAVSPQTLTTITQPITDLKSSAAMANMVWRTYIAAGVSPREAAKQHIMPRPENLEELVLLMPMGFKSEAAGDLDAVVQYDFSGPVDGSCHFKICDGQMSASLGKADNPALTIASDFDLWLDVMSGKVNGQEAFMQGKASASGDLALLLKVNQVFGA